MHDCEKTKGLLVDLAFGEAADADRLRAEIEPCVDCRAESRAVAATLAAFDRAAAVAEPTEEFWAGYHSRLARRLDAETPGGSLTPAASAADASPAGGVTPAGPAPFASRLRRALAARWRVPAPIAVAAALAIVCLSAFALVRNAPEPLAVAAPAQEAEHGAAVRVVEVPVVREKIVTRTVYVGRRQAAPGRVAGRGAGNELARHDAAGERQRSTPRAGADTLVGFRPAGDVKLRVIKGSFEDER
jgi:hypothetical protein